jgi:hypothetical protein
VSQILEDRWRSARNGRAWGSNGEVSDSDAVRHSTSDRAANNVLAPVARRPYGGALSTASRAQRVHGPNRTPRHGE